MIEPAGSAVSHTLRPAGMSDARLLFGWVNDPEALARKELTGGPIPWDEHRGWLAERLDDDDTLMFIVERGETPAGQVRLQRRGNAFEIDIFIVPDARGRGLAKMAVAAALDALEENRPGAIARARVKSDNQASIRLFESLGFEKAMGADDDGEGEYLDFRRGPAARSEQP